MQRWRIFSLVGLGIATVLNIMFLVYICVYFISKPFAAWYTISDYRDINIALILVLHFIATIPTLVLGGPLLIFLYLERQVPRWVESLYAICGMASALTGVTILLQQSSAARSIGDCVFIILAFCALRFASAILAASTSSSLLSKVRKDEHECRFNDTDDTYTLEAEGLFMPTNADISKYAGHFDHDENTRSHNHSKERIHRVSLLFWTLFGATMFRIFLLPMLIQEWTAIPIFTNYITLVIYLTIASLSNLLPITLYGIGTFICNKSACCIRRQTGSSNKYCHDDKLAPSSLGIDGDENYSTTDETTLLL